MLTLVMVALVAGVLIGSGPGTIQRAIRGFGPHLLVRGFASGDPTYGPSTFYSSYALSYGPKSNQNGNCPGEGIGTYEQVAGANGPNAGVYEAYAGWNPTANSKCNSVYWYDQQWLGAHAGNYTPSSAGIYLLTANFTVDIYVQLYAWCGSSYAYGSVLPDYAEVNVSAWVAAWDNSLLQTNSALGTGPNTVSNYLFHLTTQDFSCSSGSSINQNITFNRAVQSSSRLYLQSGNEYQFRAALEFQVYVVSAYTGGSQYPAMGQYDTYSTNTQLTSLSITTG